MDRALVVHVDIDGHAHTAGRLWTHVRKNKESATFEYDKAWLSNPLRFALEPALTLGPGPFHTTSAQALFGAIGDSAPDRWGRTLMRRAERQRAARAGETPRTLWEANFLLSVDDETRLGALRFAETIGGPFLAESDARRIPPLIDLPSLLAASKNFLAGADSEDDLRLLLAPGSSLGGARPKASIRDHDGGLALAKFPKAGDETRTVLWEAVALTLAAQAGIQVPQWRIEAVAGQQVLVLRRFDRADTRRVPFLSAMSMLGAKDNESRTYLEIADALRQHGAAPKADLRALWRRIVFNVLISNTDDHLRNHAFLYAGTEGWRLSPAYDMNPVPTDVKPRALSTAIDEIDNDASLARAIAVAQRFGLNLPDARTIAGEVGRAVAGWSTAAGKLGLESSEINRMASAFEHDDLKLAQHLNG